MDEKTKTDNCVNSDLKVAMTQSFFCPSHFTFLLLHCWVLIISMWSSSSRNTMLIDCVYLIAGYKYRRRKRGRPKLFCRGRRQEILRFHRREAWNRWPATRKKSAALVSTLRRITTVSLMLKLDASLIHRPLLTWRNSKIRKSSRAQQYVELFLSNTVDPL